MARSKTGTRTKKPNRVPKSRTPAADRAIALELVALDRFVPSPDQVKDRTKSSPELKTLAATIKAQGIVQPVVARPSGSTPANGRGPLVIVAGHRRVAAAKLAGLTVVPTIVRTALSDDDAATATVIENLARADLTFPQQVEAIATLADRGIGTAAIAKSLGATDRWVRRRLTVRNLIPDLWKRLSRPDDWFGRLQQGVIQRLASLPEPTQRRAEKMLADWFAGVDRTAGWAEVDPAAYTPAQFDADLGKLTRELVKTPWKLDVLVPGVDAPTCSLCPKRTGAEPGGLFADFDPIARGGGRKTIGDRCLDLDCFTAKHRATLAELVAAEKKKHPKLIQIGVSDRRRTGTEGPLDADPAQVRPADNWSPCKKNAPGARRAVVVSGPGAGSARYVRPRRTDAQAVDRSGKKTIASPAEVVAAKRKRHQVAAVQDRLDAMVEGKKPKPIPMDRLSARTLAELVVMFGAESEVDATRLWDQKKTTERWARTKKRKDPDLAVGLARGVLSRISGYLYHDQVDLAAQVADLLGWPWADFVAASIEAHPDPKPAAKPARGKRTAKIAKKPKKPTPKRKAKRGAA